MPSQPLSRLAAITRTTEVVVIFSLGSLSPNDSDVVLGIGVLLTDAGMAASESVVGTDMFLLAGGKIGGDGDDKASVSVP